MSKANRQPDADGYHTIQLEGLQMVLFSMDGLGTKSAFMQMELDGVTRYLAAAELTQLEFDAFVKKSVLSGRASGEAAARPL